MAIPVIGEILDAVKAVVDWTLKTVPKPILFMLCIC